jgi:hypothetical protein
LPPSTTKRVLLYRWDRQPEEGFINPSSYLHLDHLEWLSVDGRLQQAGLELCKAVCFASEGTRTDLFTHHNLFERRPRVAGLWTRFFLRDGSVLDGMLSHNLLEWPEAGYLIVPPPARAARQKVFLPRVSLVGTELRGVVGGSTSPLAKKSEGASDLTERQLSIFE